MHASDRTLISGTIDDLRQEEDSVGYAMPLRHGEIGQGMNNDDAHFSTRKGVDFDGWINIENSVEGFDQLQGSVKFLLRKMTQH